MVRLLVLVCMLFVVSMFATAQKVPGYYISKSGDTVRGFVQVPVKAKLKVGASSQANIDPFSQLPLKEATSIDYSALTFDFRFAQEGEKEKKIDRLKVKGFGFTYEGRAYDFIQWDVAAQKQLYLVPATGDVVPDGVYFVLRSIEGKWPVYSLFQEVEMSKKSWNHSGDNRPAVQKTYDGNVLKRDVVFAHPTKGLIYISDQYPLKMKFSEALAYLGLEDAFIRTLRRQDTLLEVVMKYNEWKQ